MTNVTAIGVAAAVALVAAPLFVQPWAGGVPDNARVRAVLEARIRAVEEGDRAAMRATADRGFEGLWIGGHQESVPWVEPPGSTVVLDSASLHFPSEGVATVSGTWTAASADPGVPGHERSGLLTYVLRKRWSGWFVSRVTLLSAATRTASAP